MPDPTDPSIQVNTAFVATVERADMVLLAGQSWSHCVANTMLDTAANFSDPVVVHNLVLLEGCTSEVPNSPGLTVFSDFTKRVMADMKAKGELRCTGVSSVDAYRWPQPPGEAVAIRAQCLRAVSRCMARFRALNKPVVQVLLSGRCSVPPEPRTCGRTGGAPARASFVRTVATARS